MVNKITPLIGGTHFPIGLKDNNFGILAAKVPAKNNGTICPIAKLPRKIMPVKGFPCFPTHARRTARTGVVHGEEANPNAKPAETGASEGGTCFLQISGSGPDGSEILRIPSKFRPMIIAKKPINIEKKPGN